MIKIKDLEDYFGASFEELIKENDIVEVGDDLELAWKNYYEWELRLYGNDIKALENEFKKWVKELNNVKDLMEYELSTYQRHFQLDNGKIYYLNNYI